MLCSPNLSDGTIMTELLVGCETPTHTHCCRFQTCWGHMDRVKQIWFLSPMRAAKVQASLGIRAVSPEPSLLAHTSSESRGTFRQKARSLAPLNGWACAVKICHDRMLEDTNSLDGPHMRKSPVLEDTNSLDGPHMRKSPVLQMDQIYS